MSDLSVKWMTDEGEIPATILLPWDHDGAREWTAYRNDMPGVWAAGATADDAEAELRRLIAHIEGRRPHD